MLLFSEYLLAKHPKAFNSLTVFNGYFLTQWLEENRTPSFISTLGLYNIYQTQFNHFEKSLNNALNDFFKNDEKSVSPKTPSDYIRFIDLGAEYFRKSFLYMVQLKSKDNPWSFPSYTFNASQSGVSIETYIHTGTGVQQFQSSHSGLGKNSKTLNKDEKTKLESNLKHFCVDSTHIRSMVEKIKKSAHHGEEAWMGFHALEFIEYLKTLRQLEFVEPKNLNAYDLDWLQNFTSLPRIEFVLNTSPCSHCQGLFKKLREKLNQEGIYLPILIYSIFPYNTDEVEMSQVNVLSFKGEFIQTKLFMNTPYDQSKRPVLDIASNAKLENALEFDANIYPLILKLHLESDNSIQKALFNQLLIQIEKLSLSQIDMGVIKAFLNHFPNKLRNAAQVEYDECLTTLEKASQSIDSSLPASGLQNLFTTIFKTKKRSLEFDESEIHLILQLTALLENIPQQTNHFIFNLVFSSIFYISTKLIEEHEEPEDLASYVIGGQF